MTVLCSTSNHAHLSDDSHLPACQGKRGCRDRRASPPWETSSAGHATGTAHVTTTGRCVLSPPSCWLPTGGNPALTRTGVMSGPLPNSSRFIAQAQRNPPNLGGMREGLRKKKTHPQFSRNQEATHNSWSTTFSREYLGFFFFSPLPHHTIDSAPIICQDLLMAFSSLPQVKKIIPIVKRENWRWGGGVSKLAKVTKQKGVENHSQSRPINRFVPLPFV